MPISKFATILDGINYIEKNFTVVDTIYVDQYIATPIDLYLRLQKNYKNAYSANERIVLVVTQDFYKDHQPGIMLHSIQNMLDDIDISNFFVCFVTTNSDIQNEYETLQQTTNIINKFEDFFICQGSWSRHIATTQVVFTKYHSFQNYLDQVSKLTEKNKNYLFNSTTFCMAPWVGVSVSTNGQVKTCPISTTVVGNCNSQSLHEIWNSTEMKSLRADMLSEQTIPSCKNCYNNEQLGIKSLRNSYNKSFVKRAYKVDSTASDGYLDDFSLNFIDARFTNLCNLVCRTCDSQNSSSWHRPSVALKLTTKHTPALLVAGRSDSDLIDQVIDHVEHLDRIYFCGGEPMMIKQFYDLLEVLDSKSRHDIELIYNINLTRLSLKHQNIFDLWKNFRNISIGASLDGEYERGEYIRIGTNWNDVLINRQQMIDQRPDIDFYARSTVSILNVLHLPDFHKSWSEKGLINPDQFDIGILFEPLHFAIHTAPDWLKDQIRNKYQAHLEWLRPKDRLGRATNGFQSVLNRIETPGNFDKDNFWKEIDLLDEMYKMKFHNVFPELKDLPR
jgi:radical SAM protein with 4Fe4S-binding SPASM domain